MTVHSAHLVVDEWTLPRRVLDALQRFRDVPEDAWEGFGEDPRELTGEHWFHEPQQVREERAGIVAVRDGDRWWIRDPDGTVETGDGRTRTTAATMVLALLDPSSMLEHLTLDPQGAGTRAGRPTIEFTALPVADADRMELSLLGGNAESWEISLDAGTGALLAAAALLDGTPYQRFHATTVELDIELDPHLFAPP